ncbi:MAG TPA: hypothetical protein VFT74_05995 [Isosphaeraceae bacterium]|nr:hypothetical protein [Isosphaeraceae bacterium]
MLLALGLVLSTLGADNKTPRETPTLLITPSSSAPLVQYEARFVSTAGLQWRTDLADHLHLVTRQEGATVWMADDKTVSEILKQCEKETKMCGLAPPRTTTELGKAVELTARHRQTYVAEMNPSTTRDSVPDGEVVRTSFEPETATLDLGPTVRVDSSQMVGVGVQAAVTIENRRLLAMHQTVRRVVVEERREFAVPVLSKIPFVGRRLFRNVGIGRQPISATVEFPEVSSQTVEGDWLIPSEGALIVSLGPVSNAENQDQPVGESLVILSARVLPIDPAPVP